MKPYALAAAIAIAALAGACERAGDPEPPPPASTSSPEVALAAMDERIPVPLAPMMAHHQKQNMRDHLLAVQEITAALAAGDFGAVEASAGRIGYSAQMGQMCSHMGAGAPGFTDAALSFHHTADTIAEAAKSHDAAAVLTALSRTLATCTGCHAAFKQQLVTEPP